MLLFVEKVNFEAKNIDLRQQKIAQFPFNYSSQNKCTITVVQKKKAL